MLFTLTTTESNSNSHVCITPKSRIHGVLFFLVLDVLNIRRLGIRHAYRDVWYATYCMSKRTEPSFFFLFLVKEQSFPCCWISQAYTAHTCHVTLRARSFLPLLLTRTGKHTPHSSTFLPETEKAFSLLLQPLFVSLSNWRRSLDLDKSKNVKKGGGCVEKRW